MCKPAEVNKSVTGFVGSNSRWSCVILGQVKEILTLDGVPLEAVGSYNLTNYSSRNTNQISFLMPFLADYGFSTC